MTTNNWAIPRDQAIDVAVASLRLGWVSTATQAAETMIRCHYRGVSPDRAIPLFTRDVITRYIDQCGGITDAQVEIIDMANQLQTEGWRLLPADDGWVWYHEATHTIPSRNGGTFKTLSDATRFVFESATRELLSEAPR